LFAGLLAGGAVFAALLGLVLLPFSLIGLSIGIGALGFSPFVTAFVFLRNAVRAFRRCGEEDSAVSVWSGLGLILFFALPWAAHAYADHETRRAVAMVRSGGPDEAMRGMSLLRSLRPLANVDRLVLAYESEEDKGCRGRLAAAYHELTGGDIRHRLVILRD